MCHNSTTTTLGNVNNFCVWKSTFIKWEKILFANIVLFINILFINTVLKRLHKHVHSISHGCLHMRAILWLSQTVSDGSTSHWIQSHSHIRYVWGCCDQLSTLSSRRDLPNNFQQSRQRHWSLVKAREVGGNRCRMFSNWSVEGHQKGHTPPLCHPDWNNSLCRKGVDLIEVGEQKLKIKTLY